MLDILSSLLNTITSVITFVINTVVSLVRFFTMIPTYSAFLFQSINVLPSILLPFVTVCIGLYILLFIINRR